MAQSTASFPEPPGATPKPAPTPAPVVAPPPVVSAPPPVVKAPASAPAASAPPRVAQPTVPAPAPSSAPPRAPAARVDTTTDRRYPTLSGPSALPPAGKLNLNLAPAVLPYRAGTPVPPGYRLEHRAANGLIIGGVASLAVGYITALAVGGNDDFKNGTGWVLLPVVGPWAAIGARAYHCDNSATDVLQAQKAANQCVRGAFNEVQTIAILSADAVVQATGAVLFLAGLASGEDQLVRDDLQAHVRVTPRAVGANGFGIGFDGRF